MKPKLILICHNQRDADDPKGCCYDKHAPLVYEKFRAELEKRKLSMVRLVPTGCLGPCADGVCVAIQPDDVYYGKVRAIDVAAIIDEHVVGGRPVQRLMLSDEALD